jgi:hypothetical protein
MEAPPFLLSQTPCVLSCKGNNVCEDELYQKAEATKVNKGTDCRNATLEEQSHAIVRLNIACSWG